MYTRTTSTILKIINHDPRRRDQKRAYYKPNIILLSQKKKTLFTIEQFLFFLKKLINHSLICFIKAHALFL